MNKKIKLAVSTLSFQDMELDTLLGICQQSGIEALELRPGLSEWSRLEKEKDCACFLDKIRAYHLCISDLATSVCVNTYQPEALELLRQNLLLAQRLQVRGLRIMLGTYRNFWSEKKEAPDYAGICRWMSEADRLAGTYGKELWVETHYEFATGKSLKTLWTDSSLQNSRVLWDVMHPLEQGETMEETMQAIGGYLTHVHVKDGLPWPDPDRANWKYTEVGKGQIPLKHFMELLVRHGYDGYYSLEWEPMWREELRGFDEGQVIRNYGAFMNRMIREINLEQA